ncbi:MAG: hypothetical protein SFX18_13295 [Pirellulales bacterium]|nr:hypothetical protein [Pirellulales bacterium]
MQQRELAKERESRRVCIVCEDGSTRITRGLCAKHYEKYRAKFLSLPLEKRPKYDEFLIERGLLMPNRQGKKLDDDDPFADALDQFKQAETLAAGPFPEDPHLNRQVFQALAKIDAEAAKQPPAPKEVVPEKRDKPVKTKKESGK